MGHHHKRGIYNHFQHLKLKYLYLMINGSESRTPELAVSLAVYEYVATVHQHSYFAPFCVYQLYPLTDELTISVRFLGKMGIILRVLRLAVSIYNVTLQTSFSPFLLTVEVTVNSKEENS